MCDTILLGKTYTTLGPATSPDFFAPHNKDKHTPEYDSVGMLPRALRDLFAQLDAKCQIANGKADEIDNPATAINNENNAINGESSSSHGSDMGIPAATKSPARPSNNTGSNNSNNNNNSGTQPFEYKVKLQFLELYGEEIRDLITTSRSPQQTKITIRDQGGDAEALGATSVPVSSASEAMVTLTRGMLRRVTGATSMNAESSRSHAIMSIMIEQTTRSNDDNGEGEAVIVQKSKFNFVDLAGSERQKRTNAKGQRMKEGININKGLLVLGNVISALASSDKKKFVPFRDSKLTRLLRGSLGGNHKTLMIACASPSHKNAEESLNCLRYANRAKNIQNKAVINVDPHSKLVNTLKRQVSALAGELLRLTNRGGGKVDNERFTLELLEVLVKGGKDAQAVAIGDKGKPGQSDTTSDSTNQAAPSSSSTSELEAELEKTRMALKESQHNLADKSEQLEAITSERDNLRRVSSDVPPPTASKATAAYSVATPSKAIGMARGESIQDIVTNLEDGSSDVEVLSPEIQELSSEVQTLTQALNEKSESLDAALEENALLMDRLRDTPDIDEETIHYIINNIASYDDQRIMEAMSSENEEDASSSSDEEEEVDDAKREKNEQLSNFASAMFSTGKFLVDREMFEDSIACFETVLEVRRELYGWDDPLVGDALHMEGFVRSKLGDYDRALMLLWDALRIRKITSEPLKISATLRLLADLHFSKEENMHAALFYEECARQLKEYDLEDPHLPLVLIDLARTKDRLGEYGESMNFFEEALALYGRCLDADDDRIASLQYEMGVSDWKALESVEFVSFYLVNLLTLYDCCCYV